MREHPGLQALNMSLSGDEGLEPVPRGVRRPIRAIEETSELSTDIIPKMWAVYGTTYSPCEKATKAVPAGHYIFRNHPERGIFLSEKSVNMDELLVLPDSASDEIVRGIEKFWTKEEHYRRFKFLWKRGVLLWGRPGSGKTSTVQIISDRIVKRGGLVIYIGIPQLAIQGLDILRYIEPNRPILAVLEDLDDIIETYGEAELLSLLDGEFQVDNAVFIATTNYPENLDQRIINRPSRFDIVKKIDMPNEEARRVYLTIKNPRLAESKKELERWIVDTEHYSIAHMKELIISVECLELPYEDVTKRLKEMLDKEISSSQAGDDSGFGFTS